MRNYIITPTFIDHFIYIDKYLKSAQKNIEDKENIVFCFTISKDEHLSLRAITDPYSNDLNIEILFFEDLLEHFNIERTPNEILKLYGKYSFQTLKKIYTMLYIEAERFLVLDSESMWLRPVRMSQKFDEFFAAPFIAGSSIKKRKEIDLVMLDAIKNVDYLLRFECDKWFLENFVWYYDKKILNDLFNETSTPIELVDCIYQKSKFNHIKSGVLEIILYHNFIYKNAERYGYKVINIDEELDKYLTQKEIEDYKNNFYRDCQGRNGLIELALNYLTTPNVNNFAQLFINNKFDIIRCENSFKVHKLQKQFVSAVKPIIFAASQEHLFGINADPKIATKIKSKQEIKRAKSFIRRAVKFSFRKISPSYKVVSEMRDMFNAHIHDHYRLEHIFRHEVKAALQGKPTALLSLIEDIKQETTETILQDYQFVEFKRKEILLIGDNNTNLASYMLSFGANLTFANSNVNDLRILKNKYPSSKFVLITDDAIEVLNELSKKYDYIFHLSAVNEWNTKLLSQSFSLSDNVIFVTHLLNDNFHEEVFEKNELIEIFLTETEKYNFIHSVENYKSIMLKKGWEVKTVIKEAMGTLPGSISTCFWFCQK